VALAIVGTAYVRLRVIGDKLKNDIASATQDAVDKSAPALKNSGEEVGERVSEGVGDALNRSVGSQMGRVADEIGDAIGRRMAENMGRSLRRRAGSALSSGMGSLGSAISSLGDRLTPQWDKVSAKWAKQSSMNFGKMLRGGLAAALSLAIVALPSALAFTGAIAGALVSTLVPAIASIGPAAAGAGVAAVAAFSAIKISAGLLGIAMKTETAALEDFEERLTEFKATIGRPIQEGMLSGFNAAMRLAQPAVTALQPQLRTLGTVVGDVAIRFGDMARQGPNIERLQRVFAANNVFVSEAGRGATALGQAFLILLDNLRPVTTFLGTLIRDMGEWVLRATESADASGRLGDFITRSFDALRYFVGILVDFGVGIWNVFQAAHGASGGMLTNLHDIAENFRAWTGSEEGQTRMTAFFERMRIITGRVLEIFGQLAGAGARALEGTDVNSVVNGLNTLVSVGQSVGQIFGEIRAAAGPQLAEAFRSFADLLVGLAESGVIGILASAFANLFQAISWVLAIPGVGSILSLVAGLASLKVTMSLLMGIATKLWTLALKPLIGAITALAGVVGWPIVAIGALVAALVWFFTQTELGRDIIQAVWDAIVAAFNWAVDAIGTAISFVWDILQGIWDFIVTVGQGIWNAVSTAFNAVVGVITTVFNTIWNVIQTVLGVVWGIISGFLNILWEIWSRIFGILLLPIRIFYGVVLLIWNGIVASISWAINAIWTVITTVWNAIWGFLQPIIQTIWNFITTAWNAIYGAVSGAISAVWGVITSVWNAIWGFISGILNRIGGVISSVWNGIVNTVRTVLGTIRTVIESIWNGITGFIGGAMDTISGLIGGAWDFISGVGEAVLEGIKSAVNVVIDVINTIIDGINWAIDLANNLPGPDIPMIPSIPRLARGGVVSPEGGGTLAMIAEAGKSERVEPLDPNGLSRRDHALIEKLAGGRGSGEVHVYIGTRELVELVDVVVEEREENLADRVLTGTKG
jgi:phage-related protein